jgi:hypothetical protein
LTSLRSYITGVVARNLNTYILGIDSVYNQGCKQSATISHNQPQSDYCDCEILIDDHNLIDNHST